MSHRGNASRYQDKYQEEYSESEEEDCCVCLSRMFVFWCNVALLCFGLAAIGYSIYLWVTPDIDWAGEDLALKFTIFSAFLIIIALLGITGTWDEVGQCDLVVYLILIISIVIAQIAFVIYAATEEASLKDYLRDIWDDWSDARKSQAMESYDCGLYQPGSTNVTGESGVIINQAPLEIANCVNAAATIDYCFEDCYTEAKDAITTIGALTSTFLIIFALLELMLLIASFHLCCNPVDYESSSEEYDEPRKPQKYAYGGAPREQQGAYRNHPKQPQGHYGQSGAQPYRGQQRGVQMTRGQGVY